MNRGIYVYDNLAILIAIWMDPLFVMGISKLVNEGVNRELHFKYGSIIKEKDDKIDILTNEIKELRAATKKQTGTIEKQTLIVEYSANMAKLKNNYDKLLECVRCFRNAFFSHEVNNPIMMIYIFG